MAELQNYQHAESLVNPDDLQLSNDHESTRLERQTQAAQAEVSKAEIDGGLSGFFDSFDARNRNSINKLTIDTSRRVMDVLGASATNYQSGLSGGSSAHLEKLAWDHYQGDVLTRLGDIKANTSTSISLAEGYEKFLAEAQSKTQKEWEDQKAANAEALKNFGRWDRLFKARSYEKFEAAADKEIQDMFAELNKNMAQVKKESQTRATNMENRVKRTWESVIDPAQKANHWAEIKSAVSAPNITGLNAPLFLGRAPSDQDKVDFAEALGRLDFVRSGLGLAEKSAQINKNQRDLIESGHEQQKLIDLNGNFKFESLLSKPIFQDYPANADNAPTDKELLDSILADLQRETANIEALFGGTVKKQELLTNSAKLVILVKELDRNNGWRTHLSSNTRQKYVDWMQKKDEESKSEVTPYNNGEATRISSEIQGTLSTKLLARLNEANSFDITTTDIPTLTRFHVESVTFSQLCALEIEKLNQIKNLPEEDKQKLSEALEKLNNYALNLVKAGDKWIADRRAFEVWEKQETDANTAVGTANTNITYAQQNSPAPIQNANGAQTPAPNEALTAAQQQLRDATAHLNAVTARKPIHTPLPSFQEMANAVHVWQNTSLTLSSSTNAPVIESLDRRIRRHIGVEFKTELEQKFIEKMAKNDQYDLLSKMSVGTQVQVTHQVAGATSSIDFPRQLNGSDENFRITRIIDGKGIQLENLAGNRVLTLFGAFASGGQVFKNGLIATKNTGSGVVSTGQSVLAYNFKII